MKISLVYTSRRAHAIRNVIGVWLKRAAYPQRIEIILGIDADYNEGIVAAQRTGATLVINPGPFNCVAGWNAAAAQAKGDVLMAIADDFSPPERWDEGLKNVGPDGWWEDDKVVAVSDGYNPDLFTLAILTKRRYDRFGYIFYCGYQSLFCDTEFTFVARQEDAVINAKYLLFEHLHPDAGKRPRDAVDGAHASAGRWKRGEMLFNLRRETGFPLDAGPRAAALEAGYASMKFAVYVQAIRDDLCLAEAVSQVIQDGAGRVAAVYIFVPDEYWGGKLRSEDDLREVKRAESIIRERHPFLDTRMVPQRVVKHRLPGLSRIQIETRVRNEAIGTIRENGCEHIIILDGDELWRPGLFSRLMEFVQERRPNSVYTSMTPVIGLPGYPVEGATDKATVYIGPGAWFTECRGVSGYRHELTGVDVIHFTGTRRTMQEIISKTLESGHADDPKYRMEEWIEKVLPNIRPGFSHQWSPTNRGLHMYLPYQVWPSCRAWTLEEWAMLPDSVKPYLAKPLAEAMLVR